MSLVAQYIFLWGLILVVILALGAGWNYFFIFRPLRRNSWNFVAAPVWISFTTTVSLFVVIYYILRDRLIDAVLGLLFPPIGLFELSTVSNFWPFLSTPILWAGSAACLVLVGCVALGSSILKRLSLAAALCCFLLTLLLVAERQSRELMISEAQSIGATTLERHSFWWSLRNAPREFQFEVHALAIVDGTQFIWSYGERKFVVIEPTVWAGMSEFSKTINLNN